MIFEWQQQLVTNAAQWGMPSKGAWKFLVHNNFHPHYSSLNVFWFYETERFPRAVAKACREKHVVEREYENLRSIHALLHDQVPRPLSFNCINGFWILWIVGVPGLRIPIQEYYPAETLIPIIDLLVTIHRILEKAPSTQSQNRHTQMITNPLQAVIEFGPDPSVRSGCRELADRASAEWLGSLPVIPQHGDVFLDNIVRDKRQYRLVDWESFGAVDYPFFDLIMFLTSLLRSSGATSAHWDTRHTGQISSLVRRYAMGLNLSLSSLPVLIPLTLAKWFELEMLEGRKKRAEHVYASIKDYFDNTSAWHEVFLGPPTNGENV